MATKTKIGQTTVIAVYPDHESAEDAVRRLKADGVDIKNVSIIGKDFQAVEKPLGFVTAGSVAKDGAKVGAGRAGCLACSSEPRFSSCRASAQSSLPGRWLRHCSAAPKGPWGARRSAA